MRIVPENAAKSGRRSDEDWAVVWDDCLRKGGLMPTVQNKLVPLARAASSRRLCFAQLWIGGWSVVHENPHGACILTTLDLPTVLSADNTAAAGANNGPAAVSARKSCSRWHVGSIKAHCLKP